MSWPMIFQLFQGKLLGAHGHCHLLNNDSPEKIEKKSLDNFDWDEEEEPGNDIH